MNNYSFPDTVVISDSARDIITRILNNDPARRPTVDEILSHPWIQNEGSIPKLLPPSTLACPPSQTYIRQFQNPNGNGQPIVPQQRPATEGGATTNTGGLDRNFGNRPATERKVIQPREAEVWVKKWVDYSTKYGLGYYLSNEATGVFFNDSTKIVLDPNGHNIDYMERRSSDRQDVGTPYTLTEYPKEL